MSAIRVAFQGERGAYREQAALAIFAARGSGSPELVPQPTFDAVFAAVESADCDYGVVPMENSLAGSVHRNYDLLLQHDLHIVAEHNLRVSHCLIAHPGVELREIRRVYSHPQALAQCSGFLRRHGLEAVATGDTAGSARLIREQELRGVGAIASGRAARIYELEVLAQSIEDRPDNQTRFFVIGREMLRFAGPAKTTLIMGTAHRPGALHSCLGAFARRGINLMRLESRPSRARPWEYIFYVDCEGHAEDPAVAQALEELQGLATYLKVLGSFPLDR